MDFITVFGLVVLVRPALELVKLLSGDFIGGQHSDSFAGYCSFGNFIDLVVNLAKTLGRTVKEGINDIVGAFI